MADKDNCHNLGGGKGAFCRWDPETKFCIPRDVPEEISKDTSPEENITPTDVEEDPKEEETTISPRLPPPSPCKPVCPLSPPS